MTAGASDMLLTLDQQVELAQRLTRIEDAQTHLASSMDDLRKALNEFMAEQRRRYDDHEARLRNVETTHLTCAARTRDDLEDCQADILTLRGRADKVEDKVAQMWPVTRAMLWVAAPAVLAILALVWGIITHSIQIVMK